VKKRIWIKRCLNTKRRRRGIGKGGKKKKTGVDTSRPLRTGEKYVTLTEEHSKGREEKFGNEKLAGSTP